MPQQPPYNVSQFPRRKRQPFEAFCPASWEGQEPEPTQWLVQNCVPRGSVCLFSGDSGLGKSLLMQQLQTSCATGMSWLGNAVERVRSFGFYCEDPRGVLQWRQRDICKHMDITEADLEAVSMAFRVGMDNTLMDFNRRTDEGQATELFSQLQEHIRDIGAELVIIDTLAHTFNGNENVRAHVTAFIGVLQQIANDTGGAVILCSHPSVSSMSSGTGYSGSTAWRASVRAHMYLKRPKGYDDEADDANSDERILKTMKSNWGAGNGLIRMRWEQGVFVAERRDDEGASGAVGKIELDSTVWSTIANMVENGHRVGKDPFARNSIGFIAKQIPALRTHKRAELENSVERLINAGRLVVVEIGRPSHRYKFIRPPAMSYPGEGNE